MKCTNCKNDYFSDEYEIVKDNGDTYIMRNCPVCGSDNFILLKKHKHKNIHKIKDFCCTVAFMIGLFIATWLIFTNPNLYN